MYTAGFLRNIRRAEPVLEMPWAGRRWPPTLSSLCQQARASARPASHSPLKRVFYFYIWAGAGGGRNGGRKPHWRTDPPSRLQMLPATLFLKEKKCKDFISSAETGNSALETPP